MKLYVGLVHVVAILVFTGSSLGDVEGDLAQPRSCPVTIDDGEQMHSQIYRLGLKCLETTGTDFSHLMNVETLEEHKDFFKEYCQKQSQIRECLADVTVTSRACQNESRHQLFQVFRELLENTLDSGCVQDGEVLANMVTTFKHNSTISSNPNHLRNCLTTLFGRVKFSSRVELSDFSRMYIFYRDIVQAKECLNIQTGGDQNIAGGMVTLLSEISEKLQCFHPQDDSVLLCKNLDPNSVGSPMVCPIKSKDELTKPLYGLLLDRLPDCVMVVDTHENTGLHVFEYLDETRKYFKRLCAKKRITLNCLSEVVHLSSACLDTNHHLKLTTVEEFFENLFEHVCMEDGVHFANVMFNVMNNVANKSGPSAGPIAITECANVAHPHGQAIDTNFPSAKTLEYYQQFKVFKGCLVNKLAGDDNAVSSAELMLNGVINNMKCINPEETSAVLCETIASNA